MVTPISSHVKDKNYILTARYFLIKGKILVFTGVYIIREYCEGVEF